MGFVSDNIDGWIRLLTPAAAPRLESMFISGEESVSRILCHTSVLVVQRLVSMNLLLAIFVENIPLQDKQDWVTIVQSLDPARLKTFHLYGKSHSQFLSASDAVDLSSAKLSGASNGS